MYLSAGRTFGHHPIFSDPLAYCKVASISKLMPLKIRFQIMPEIRRISSRVPFDSRSIIDAIFKAVSNEIIDLVELENLSAISLSNLSIIVSATSSGEVFLLNE